MFQRRLLLLFAVAMVCVGIMGGQTLRLTSGSFAAQARHDAESLLVTKRFIPTIRGAILDRNGLVLAEDRPSYELAVAYDVITGRWAYQQAVAEAVARHPQAWKEADPDARYELIDRYRARHQQRLETFFNQVSDLTHTPREKIEAQRLDITERVQRIGERYRIHLYEELVAMDQDADWSEVLPEKVRDEVQAHPLVFDLDQAARFEIERRINDANQHRAQRLADADSQASLERFADPLQPWLSVSLDSSTQRRYPMHTLEVDVDRSTLPMALASSEPLRLTVDGVAMHVIGRMVDGVDPKVYRNRPFYYRDAMDRIQVDLGGYRPDDRVGRFGIEGIMESQLRGQRGEIVAYRDGRGKKHVEPRPGGKVVTTLDIRLQARIHALLSPGFGLMRRASLPDDDDDTDAGKPLNGAVVVMDVNSGEVLAAASQPMFSQRVLREDPGAIWEDHWNLPWLNRAVGRPYQAGSTVKPLVLVAAMTQGLYHHGETINCIGYFEKYGKNKYRCWHYKQVGFGHGPLDGPSAIAQSCNIFFSTLAMRLGGADLVDWYERFGMGHSTAADLPEEVNGFLPDRINPRTHQPRHFSEADAILMGIGQGQVSWTPLQAATAYTALARGGERVQPRFVRSPDRHINDKPIDLHLSRAAIDEMFQGMYRSVHDRVGTTNHLRDGELIFNLDNVKLFAKSGTAQIGQEWVDLNNDGQRQDEEVQNWGNHAWCVVLAQRPGSTRPDYVVVVVVEYGGSGGQVAGPVANQVLHALRFEGYL